jgi:hypothetical protein
LFVPGETDEEKEAVVDERGRRCRSATSYARRVCGRCALLQPDLAAAITGQHLAVNGGQWVS